jgi:hypothetical protein
MCNRLSEVLASARALVASLDASALAPSEAASSFKQFAELENLAAAGKLLVAPKVAESDEWARDGHRSAAEWIAQTSGTSVGSAKAIAETAKRVEQLPATTDALRSGGLSVAQVTAVSEAAICKPDAESELLAAAKTESVRSLQDKARRVVLESRGSVEERYARQRKLRSFSSWTDDEGMVAGRFRLTPDAGAAFVNRIRAEADRQYRQAYREGRRENPENYAADALVALVTGEGLLGTQSKSKGTEVVVVVSRESLQRGGVDPTAGEICEIPGFGAIPVSRARELLADAFLKGVLVDGKRVISVKHFGRHRPAELDTALLVRSVLSEGQVRCVVEQCGQTARIQWDHAQPFARGGPTSADNLNPMCPFHNRAKEAGRVAHTGDGRWVRTGVVAETRSPP